MKRSNIAVVGTGNWGRNLVRNFYQLPQSRLKYICDLDAEAMEKLRPQVPGTELTTNFGRVLEDPEIDAVVIATSASTHYNLARAGLRAGKHVYVEKPFVLERAHALDLIAQADSANRILMVGHLLEYHPVINELKRLISSGELGEIFYIYNQRLNLGQVRQDENALWSFAPHDISAILYLLDQEPTDVSARGQSYLQSKIEDVVFLTLNFNSKAMAHIHVSWLDPHKTRRFTVVGSKKMVVFDDMESTEKLKIYDKSAENSTNYDTFAEYVTLRYGDITIPHLRVEEPLRLECLHFLDCIQNNKRPRSDGLDGLQTVSVLEAAQRSLDENGTPVAIERADAGAPVLN